MSNNSLIRTSVRTMYDMQKLRIQTGNRIVAAFKEKLGIKPSESEEEAEEKALNILKELRAEYKRITDGVKSITKAAGKSSLLTTEGEIRLIEAYEKQLDAEQVHEKLIKKELENYQVWNEYLEDIRGVGPLMAGVIISEIDISKANTVSALWKYCGLDTINGEGRSKKAEHLIEKVYWNRAGEPTLTKGITFNPFVKTKLVGVLGSVFIKLGGEYADIYRGYKFRLENHPNWKDKTKKHRHNAAVRYMIKIFLQNLYANWRALEGLPVRPPYAEEKLGIVHSKVA